MLDTEDTTREVTIALLLGAEGITVHNLAERVAMRRESLRQVSKY